MSRNSLLLGALVLAVVLGTAAFLILGEKVNAPTSISLAPTSAQTSSGGVSSIEDVLKGGRSVECRFITEKGKQVLAYLKNGQIRADIRAIKPEESGSIIIRDFSLYFWNDETAFKTKVPEDALDPGTPGPGAPGDTAQDLVQSIQKYKKFCNDAPVQDSLFSPPSDVSFRTF